MKSITVLGGPRDVCTPDTNRCLGTLTLALQSREIRWMRHLSTENSNLVLRFCLNSVYTYKNSFGPGALSPPAESGAELLTYKYSLLFQFCFLINAWQIQNSIFWKSFKSQQWCFSLQKEIYFVQSDTKKLCAHWLTIMEGCLSFFHVLFLSVQQGGWKKFFSLPSLKNSVYWAKAAHPLLEHRFLYFM